MSQFWPFFRRMTQYIYIYYSIIIGPSFCFLFVLFFIFRLYILSVHVLIMYYCNVQSFSDCLQVFSLHKFIVYYCNVLSFSDCLQVFSLHKFIVYYCNVLSFSDCRPPPPPAPTPTPHPLFASFFQHSGQMVWYLIRSTESYINFFYFFKLYVR